MTARILTPAAHAQIREALKHALALIHGHDHTGCGTAKVVDAIALLDSLPASDSGEQVPVQIVPVDAVAVALVYHGGTQQFGYATVLKGWLSGADKLPLGLHTVYAMNGPTDEGKRA